MPAHPGQAHQYVGLGGCPGHSEGATTKSGGCGWTMCPQTWISSHVAQHMADWPARLGLVLAKMHRFWAILGYFEGIVWTYCGAGR